MIVVDLENTDEEHLKTVLQSLTRNELRLLNPKARLETSKPSGTIQQLRNMLSKWLGYTTNHQSNNTNLINQTNQTYPTHTTHTHHQLYPANNTGLLYDYNELWVLNGTDLFFLQNRYQCYRCFSKTMNYGGRFYGIINQQLPEAIRLQTLINGCAVVELDFKALHPSLLYSSIGFTVS